MVKLPPSLKSPISFLSVYKFLTSWDRQHVLCTILGTKGLFDTLEVSNNDGEGQLQYQGSRNKHPDILDKNTTKSGTLSCGNESKLTGCSLLNFYGDQTVLKDTM